MATEELVRLRTELNFIDDQVWKKNKKTTTQRSSMKINRCRFSMKFYRNNRSIMTMPNSKLLPVLAVKRRCFLLNNCFKCTIIMQIFENGLSNWSSTIKRTSVRLNLVIRFEVFIHLKTSSDIVERNVCSLRFNCLGGLRQGKAFINGSAVFQRLKYECGVHRVQRVPQTEKSGRIHTSTVTVAVLPQPKDVSYHGCFLIDLRAYFFRLKLNFHQKILLSNQFVHVVLAVNMLIKVNQAVDLLMFPQVFLIIDKLNC